MIRDRAALAPLISLLLAAIAIGIGNSAIGRPVTDVASRSLLPVQQLLSAVLSPIGQFVGGVSELGGTREDNDRLRRAVDLLNAEVVRLREAEIENERLRSMLDFRRRSPEFQLVPARIVALDPNAQVRSATIDRGADAGLKDGMVAVSPSGNLVGRITQVRATTARIQYVVDTASSVNALVQRADLRALGIINGLPGDRLVMRYLFQQDQIRPGDVVVTSGLGGTYPRGIFIGQVVELRRNEADLFQEARIEPAVKFSRLDSVQVITNFVPTNLD